MFDLRLVFGKRDDFVAGDDVFIERILGLVVDLLALEGCKVGCQAIVVVLLPTIEGMVMAFGTRDTNSEEDLGGRFGRDFRVAMGSIKRGWRIPVGAAGARYKFGDPVLHRSIRSGLLAKPIVEQVRTLGAHHLVLVSDQVAPSHGPSVVKAWVGQQLVDSLFVAHGA